MLTDAFYWSYRRHRSLCAQLLRVYGNNRKHASPLDLHLTGLDGAPAKCLPPPEHLQAWEAGSDVTLLRPPAVDVWLPEQTVWLSPDAEVALEAPLARDDGRVLIIGGLIDRSVKKRATLERALASGAQARRLPIREHAPRSDLHPILTLTACVHVLCELNGGAAWSDAFARAIPQREIQRRVWEETPLHLGQVPLPLTPLGWTHFPLHKCAAHLHIATSASWPA